MSNKTYDEMLGDLYHLRVSEKIMKECVSRSHLTKDEDALRMCRAEIRRLKARMKVAPDRPVQQRLTGM